MNTNLHRLEIACNISDDYDAISTILETDIIHKNYQESSLSEKNTLPEESTNRDNLPILKSRLGRTLFLKKCLSSANIDIITFINQYTIYMDDLLRVLYDLIKEDKYAHLLIPLLVFERRKQEDQNIQLSDLPIPDKYFGQSIDLFKSELSKNLISIYNIKDIIFCKNININNEVFLSKFTELKTKYKNFPFLSEYTIFNGDEINEKTTCSNNLISAIFQSDNENKRFAFIEYIARLEGIYECICQKREIDIPINDSYQIFIDFYVLFNILEVNIEWVINILEKLQDREVEFSRKGVAILDILEVLSIFFSINFDEVEVKSILPRIISNLMNSDYFISSYSLLGQTTSESENLKSRNIIPNALPPRLKILSVST